MEYFVSVQVCLHDDSCYDTEQMPHRSPMYQIVHYPAEWQCNVEEDEESNELNLETNCF